MQTVTLSDAALALTHRRLTGERVDVTDETRPLYRELVDAGMMIPLHTFALGPERHYRLSEAACDLRDGLTTPSSLSPSARAFPSRHG